MSKQVWRDDGLNKNEHPTINMTVEVSYDIYKQVDIFFVAISHVKSFHGNGFKPVLRDYYGDCCGTGTVSLGMDSVAYDKAVEEGIALAHKKVDQLLKEEESNDTKS